MPIVAAVSGHQKSRYKWKPRPLTLWLPWRQKGTLSLFLLVFGLYFHLTKHLVLIKTINMIASCVFKDAVLQSISRWENYENWASNDFIHDETSSQMADQNDDFIVTESCKSFSIFFKFQMDDKWSECRELTRKLKKW